MSMYTLQQLLTTLQSLFMDDVLTASGESGEDNDMHGTAPVIGELQGPHVRLLIKSITGTSMNILQLVKLMHLDTLILYFKFCGL